MTRTSIARTAATLIALFPAIVAGLHVVQAGNYHPQSQAVSELALGRDGWLMAIAFCSLGTGTLFLAALLRRLDSRPRTAPLLIGISGLLSFVSAFVHADGPNGTTTHGQIHQAVGVVTFVLMVSGMFVSVRTFRGDRRFEALAMPTLVWGLAAVGCFLLIPLSGTAYFGVAQRVFLAVILGWALTVAVRENRKSRRPDSAGQTARTAQEVPLAERDAELEEGLELGMALDSLRDDRDVELVGEGVQAVDERAPAQVSVEAARE